MARKNFNPYCLDFRHSHVVHLSGHLEQRVVRLARRVVVFSVVSHKRLDLQLWRVVHLSGHLEQRVVRLARRVVVFSVVSH